MCCLEEFMSRGLHFMVGKALLEAERVTCQSLLIASDFCILINDGEVSEAS